MNNSDEKTVQHIKNVSESINVPEELEPENIFENIEKNRIKYTQNKRKRMYRISASAAACVLLLISLIVLRIPMFNQDQGSAQSNLMRANSYQEIYDLIKSSNTDMNLMEDSNAENSTAAVKDFSSTNIQTEGVDEADVVKTDGNFIYVLEQYSNKLKIFEATGEQVTESSVISITYDSNKSGNPREFYLYDNKLVIISVEYDEQVYTGAAEIYPADMMYPVSSNTRIDTYDITDKGNPKKIGSVYQEGNYLSSRVSEGYLYLISNCNKNNTDLTEQSCVPDINGKPMAAKNVYLSCSMAYPTYNVITSFDINQPDKFANSISVLGSYSQLYVSNQNMYIVFSDYVKLENGGYSQSEIIKFSFQAGEIEEKATAKVKGSVNNSFSMDEYEGYLRILTTTYNEVYEVYDSSDPNSSVSSSPSNTDNNLYILDDSLNIVGKLEGLAKGESIFSARFMKNIGYFVTFKNIDPLFAVDLSNPCEPKVLGELKVTGFSDYLHIWSDNLLLGIGKEVDPQTQRTIGLKLTMYDTSDPVNLKVVHQQVLEGYEYAYFDYNHKAVLVDVEKNLIGFAGEKSYESGPSSDYFVFNYQQDSGFTQIYSEDLTTTDLGQDIFIDHSTVRGLYIKDRFFIVQPGVKITSFAIK